MPEVAQVLVELVLAVGSEAAFLALVVSLVEVLLALYVLVLAAVVVAHVAVGVEQL